jgi:murein DD-endopeptidase MepM/ murein hydrolase activator NlpD
MENAVKVKTKTALSRKTLYAITLLAVFISLFVTDKLPSVHAQTLKGASVAIQGNVLSNGQFVYGPNVGDFSLRAYLQDHASHLAPYADELYGRAEYFSINPKVYLTLLEVHASLVSHPDGASIENPFGLSDLDFISQIEYLSEIMSDAYYLHLYSYSSLPVTQRVLPSLKTQNGEAVEVASETNAGTYAIMAALSKIESQSNILQLIDDNQPNGFYQTYKRLFGSDDPLDETNHIDIPGEPGAFSIQKDSPSSLAGEIGAFSAPSDLLQLPYLRGQSWFFGGVHSNGAGGVQSPYTDASALDFGPGGVSWGSDTSNMWVVASASGIPTKISNCYFSILHAGGWETTYYHIENIQNFSGFINQNDKIGVIANTLPEALCSGGSSTGPHVHFNLKHNGALVAINGTPFSGWYVHAGRWNYDTDPNYMWLERDGVKKYANSNRLLSEAPPATKPAICATCVDADTTGVFRPGNGLLYLKNSNDTGFADVALNYGMGGDYPVVGDWDGNGSATIGIYRNGSFYLRNENTIGFAEVVFPFGVPGDQPVAGDWNGDGLDTIGVYRPSTGQFLLRNSNSAGAEDVSFYMGNAGDMGIAGDWDGNGIDTTGVFRPSNGVIFLKNSNSSGFADIALNYGLPGDRPVTGDRDNNGTDTIGVYRNGSFYLRNSNTNGFAELIFGLGNPGDIPIAGNWDGKP